MTSHVQGDLEKQELHLNPIPMMDRDYKDKLPAMQVLCVDMLLHMIKYRIQNVLLKWNYVQVEFIDQICLPVYTNLINMSEQLQPMLTG